MISINIKNPINNSVLFNKTLDIQYEVTGVDSNVKSFVFLVNDVKYNNTHYFGSITVPSLIVGKNKIIAYAINKNNKKILNTEIQVIFENKEATVSPKTEMSLFSKLSIPEFILSDYPQFVTFIQKYYKFLENSNTPYLVPFKQSDFDDIDKTSDYFIPFFYSQFLPDFPKVLALDNQTGTPLNIATVIKNIKKFYESKGTLDSYKFLFRLLFDTEIDIKYPRNKILKASSGKWIQRKSIKLFSIKDYLTREVNNRFVYQIDSNNNRTASGKVIDSSIYRIDQYKVGELFLEEYTGTFDKNKKLLCDTIVDGAKETLEYNISYCPTKINVQNGGYNYQINDRVYLRPKNYISINGSYYGDFTISDLSSDSTDAWEFIAENVMGTDFTFTSSDPVLYQDLNEYLSNTSEYIEINGVNFVPLPFNYWTFDAKDFGFNFTVPGIVRNTGKGYIGKVTKVDEKGRILQIDAVNFGFNYEQQSNDLYDVVVQSKYGAGFSGTITTGILCEYAPFYSGESGRISSSNVLQDNFYYQSHSYEINSEIDIEMYRENVLKLIHPSGYKLFGKNRINKIINNTTNIDYVNFESSDYTPNYLPEINDIEIKVLNL